MLKIYKTSSVEKKIKKIKKITADSWINLTSPTTEEIEKVVEKTKVDKDLILKMLDVEELPRIEQGENATLVVIDTPYLEEGEVSHIYSTYPLGIIITNNNYLITVSPKKVNILNDFIKNNVKDFRTAKKIRFLIQILLKTSNYYQRALKQVNLDIEKKEAVLKKSTENEDLLDLLEDAIIENKQAIEMSGIYRDILSSITDTYATVVSNNLNNVMKFLAGATIVLSIPTMISSFMGMNVPLGDFATMGTAFIQLLVISTILSIVIAIILKKKNML